MDKIKTSDLARGRWPEILRMLGVPAKVLSKKQQPCIFCGGRDRAHFANFKDSGSYFCRQCGSRNGFEFLKQYKGWTFKEAANEIDRILSTSSYASMNPENRAIAFGTTDTSVPRSTQQCALWLRKYHPEKLNQWLEEKSPEVRWWLEEQA